MRSAPSIALVALLATATATAQDESYGRDYAFDERPPETALEKLVAAKLPSLVKIHGASGLSTIVPYATGVIVSPRGHVLTLDLIMIQKDQTRVVLHDGSVYHATLYPSDRRLGVRLLKIDPGDKELVPIAPSTRADWPHGTMVVSLGNCFRLAEFSEKISATFGVLTARARTGLRYRMSDVDYDGELLITDAPNNPGHYGGALFSLSGDWIGLNTRIIESVETNTQLSAAIPTRDVAAYVDRYVRGSAPAADPEDDAPERAAYHGIRLFDHGLRRSPPAYVERVASESPAQEIGLRPDDLIVRLGSFPVRSCAEFRRVMKKFSAGDVVEVTFKRGNRVLRESMKLEEVPR